MRQQYFKQLLDRSRLAKQVALAGIDACLKEKAATADEIRLYIIAHYGDHPSGTAISVKCEHAADMPLIQVLLRTLVDSGSVIEDNGVFVLPPPHTLDSDWRW